MIYPKKAYLQHYFSINVLHWMLNTQISVVGCIYLHLFSKTVLVDIIWCNDLNFIYYISIPLPIFTMNAQLISGSNVPFNSKHL